jgi:hypothetical protein
MTTTYNVIPNWLETDVEVSSASISIYQESEDPGRIDLITIPIEHWHTISQVIERTLRSKQS